MTARAVGWTFAVISYVIAYATMVLSDGGPDWLMPIGFASVVMTTIAIGVIAGRSRYPDLWVAAIIALISPAMILVWLAPYFAGP